MTLHDPVPLELARDRRAVFSRDAGARIFGLPREQTMVSWNNAADESLSKENKALTSWVLKAHS